VESLGAYRRRSAGRPPQCRGCGRARGNSIWRSVRASRCGGPSRARCCPPLPLPHVKSSGKG